MYLDLAKRRKQGFCLRSCHAHARLKFPLFEVFQRFIQGVLDCDDLVRSQLNLSPRFVLLDDIHVRY